MRYSLRTLLIVMLLGGPLAVAVVAGAIWSYHEYQDIARNMEAGYATERVIGKIRDYVEAHDGAWPRSWDDIDATLIERQHAIPNFGLTPEEIAKEPAAIYLSVVPITWAGRETIYVNHLGPRSKFALDELRNTVLTYRTMPEGTASD